MTRLTETISIHSPRMGRDPQAFRSDRARLPFQSTLPAWGETATQRPASATPDISIHSPRMGRDTTVTLFAPAVALFQSTLPAWGETVLIWFWPGCNLFQSTLPAWGETVVRGPQLQLLEISIHSPRMGRDSKRTQLFEEKNWRICTTLYLFASKGVLPADKKTF